jgi:gliding motility-associated-like protein
MNLFHPISKKIVSWKKGMLLCLLAFLLAQHPSELFACDQSGYQNITLTDNGDGTFTITMDIFVAGGTVPNLGSTWGFYWNVDATILSVSPASLTSSNGTTLNAVFAGGNVMWGDPTPSAALPFVDVNAMGPTEIFPVTIVVSGLPSEWDGGGQEGNSCPGGAGTSPPNYEGVFPCLPPNLIAQPAPPICAGDPVQLTVTPIPAYLVDEIIWEPGGMMGETVIVAPTETTEYTVTAYNSCDEFSVTITVEVTPFPTIFALESYIEVCEGYPVIMEVSPLNELIVEWQPSGNVGNVLITTADPAVTLYTATASNQCGEASVDVNVNTLSPPTIEILNPAETICVGESIELESEATSAETVQWLPGGANGETVTVSPDSTTEYIVIASSSCGVDFDTVTISVASTDTIPVTLVACEGQNVLYNGIPLSSGSSSVFTFQNFAGCDSIVQVTIEAVSAYETPLELMTCSGSTVTYAGQQLSPGEVEEFIFTSSNGCDSVVTVTVSGWPTYAVPMTLSACAGTTVTYAGEQLSPGEVKDFTFSTVNGCDSIVTVTVASFPNFEKEVNLQTCTGTVLTYNGQSLAPGSTTVFDLTTIHGCDSTVTVIVEELANFSTSIELEACTGTTASYNGQTLNPGTTTDFTFSSILGCDSIVSVSVTEVALIEREVELSACAGESAMYNGQALLAGTITDFNFTTAQGCDSVVTVMVEELATYALPLTLEACTGSSIMYHGAELFPGTTTDVHLATSDGCDSVMTVTVNGVDDVTASLALGACTGEKANFNGQQLDPGTVTDFMFMSSLGCDSVLTVTVYEYPTYDEPLVLEACTGATVVYNGVPLPPGTSVDFTFTSVNGCDSVIAVTVEEVETIYNELEFETCEGTFITYNGQQLSPGTETDFTFTSINGCDSVVTVSVGQADLLTGVDEYSTCAGTTITYNGQTLAAGSVTDITLLTSAGCDSVVTVIVNELQTFSSPLELQACTGTTVAYNGQQLPPNTVTDFTLTASNGCDSVVTVTVNEVSILTASVGLQACTGSTAIYNGQQLAPNTVTDFTLTASSGCDSVVTVTVSEILAVSSQVGLAACTGETAIYNGQPLLAGSTTDFNLTSAQGCDSIVTVTVMELLPQFGTLQLEACPGESVQYIGQALLAGTTTDITIVAVNGCDSIVTVTVDELATSTGSVSMQGCEGETLFYNGTPVQPGSSMDFLFVNAVGCDSIVSVTALDPMPNVETSEDIEVCEGESVVIFGQIVSEPGLYTETYTSMNGCDSTHSVFFETVSDLVVDFQENIEIGLGESVVLKPLVVSGSNLTYQWQEDPTLSCWDCPNPVASPLTATTYFLTVTNELGCVTSADVPVFVRKERGIYIPNSFSPNDDGINDLFMVFSNPNTVTNISSFRIFSRWGEVVFEYYNFFPNDPDFGWDGKHRDEEMDPAVFAYMVEVEFVDGVKQLFKGDVMLVK